MATQNGKLIKCERHGMILGIETSWGEYECSECIIEGINRLDMNPNTKKQIINEMFPIPDINRSGDEGIIW